MDVDRLRAETRREHEATEALVPLMSDDLTREQYAAVLSRMYGMVRGWEVWAEQHAPGQYRALLPDRQRSHMIEADLRFLKHELATANVEIVQQRLSDHFLAHGSDVEMGAEASPADFLGAMYVVEGSTLGGQYIARHVEERFGFVDGIGNAYFRGYGDKTGSRWQEVKQRLAVLPEADSERVIAAARFMFDTFSVALTDPG